MKYSKYLEMVKTSNNWPALAGSTPQFPDKFKHLLDVSIEPTESRFDKSHKNLKELLESEMGFEKTEFTIGASQALFQTLWHLSKFYSSVAIECPYYEPYFGLAEALGFKIEKFDRRNIFSTEDLSTIKKSRIAIVTNPHFFHGYKLSNEELLEMCKRFDYVILDEVFMPQFSAENQFCSTLKSDNLIRINSLSKSLGLSSLRFGWISASNRIISELRRQSYYLHVDPPTLSQRISLNVLSHRNEILKEMKIFQAVNRDYLKTIIASGEASFSHDFQTGHFGSIKYSPETADGFPMLSSSFFGLTGYYRFRIDLEPEKFVNAFSKLGIK